MKSKLVWENSGERTYVLILDPGEEAFGRPRKLVRRIVDGVGSV
jgi:hypothetical protein